MNPAAIITSIAAIAASIAALVVAVRKTSSEIAQIATATALNWADKVTDLSNALDTERDARRALQTELSATQDNMRRELNQVKRSLNLYRKGVHLLIEQIKDAGLVAVWHPPDDGP